MSNFGDDRSNDKRPNAPQNGDGGNGYQSSPNGFRLDSTQSSWLMDRLGALGEEDKIAMSGTPQMQMADEEEHVKAMNMEQQRAANYSSSEDDRVIVVPPELFNQNHATQEVPSHMGVSGEQASGYAGEDDDDEAHYAMAQGRDDDQAAILQKKIDELEAKLAEMTHLTDDEKAKVRKDLIYRGSRVSGPEDDEDSQYYDEGYDDERAGAQQEAYGDYAEDRVDYAPEYSDGSPMQGQGPYDRSAHDRGLHDQGAQGYNPQGHEGYAGQQGQQGYGQDFQAQQNQGQQNFRPQGHQEGVTYQGQQPQPNQVQQQPQGQQGSSQGQGGYGGHNEDPLAMVPDYNYQQPENSVPQQFNQLPQSGNVHPQGQQGYYEMQRHQDLAELPQFLSPMQAQQKKRPAYVSVLALLMAVGIVGGVAYSYLGTGVSDVIKSDMSDFSGKQPMKLSSEAESAPEPAASIEDKVVPQVQPEPVIEVETEVAVADLASAFKVVPLTGVAGDNIDLNLQLPRNNSLASAFLVIRDLPDWAKMSHGRKMNGLWMVSASQVPSLQLIVPADQPGKFSFEIDLVVSAGDEPITKKVDVDVKSVTSVQEEPKVVEAPVVEKAPEKEVVASAEPEMIKHPEADTNRGPLIIDQALEEKWLERGTRLLRAGDVSAARLAFSHLAEQGSGRAALAMGMTFDPNQPSARLVTGLKTDPKQAEFWYLRALSLGNEGARDPLRILQKN